LIGLLFLYRDGGLCSKRTIQYPEPILGNPNDMKGNAMFFVIIFEIGSFILFDLPLGG
jgi:hypothetical protein